MRRKDFCSPACLSPCPPPWVTSRLCHHAGPGRQHPEHAHFAARRGGKSQRLHLIAFPFSPTPYLIRTAHGFSEVGRSESPAGAQCGSLRLAGHRPFPFGNPAAWHCGPQPHLMPFNRRTGTSASQGLADCMIVGGEPLAVIPASHEDAIDSQGIRPFICGASGDARLPPSGPLVLVRVHPSRRCVSLCV
jgi:hypothetical protein